MALILAIEPDKRQASQLTAIVRGRLKAELVLADCAEKALAALGDRVPDLILTAALLAPKDENALDERLRSLDGAAAHVQTLTIPVLAMTSRHHRGSGILSSLRRDKPHPAHAPEGCDPAVFAEQCKEYLERSVRDRQESMTAHAFEMAPTPTVEAIAEPTAAADDDVDLAVGHETFAEVSEASAAESAPVEEVPPAPVVEPEVAAAPVVNVGNVLNISHVVPDPPRKRRRKKTFDLDAADSAATLVAALAQLEAEQVKNETVERAARAVEQEFENDPYEIEPTVSETQLYAPLPRRAAWSWPSLTVMTAAAVAKAADEAARRAAGGDRQASEPVQEWVDIIEALRRDAEQIPLKGTSAAGAAVPPEPASAAKRKKKPQGAEPAQDEWGFFDPDQCGFAALLAKLEEITEDDQRRPSRT